MTISRLLSSDFVRCHCKDGTRQCLYLSRSAVVVDGEQNEGWFCKNGKNKDGITREGDITVCELLARGFSGDCYQLTVTVGKKKL
jgi:hypothetical protein